MIGGFLGTSYSNRISPINLKRLMRIVLATVATNYSYLRLQNLNLIYS
jgi:uncharacterized membrane protein YfcA